MALDSQIHLFMNQVRLSFRQNWFWITLVAAGLASASGVARAATYNFYFNNTEQGANSTASPTVVVKEDDHGNAKLVSPEPSPSPSPTVSTAVELKPEPAPESPVAQESVRSYSQGRESAPFDNSLWRYQLGFSGLRSNFNRKSRLDPLDSAFGNGSTFSNSSYSTYSSASSSSNYGPSSGVSLSLSRGISRDLTVNATVLWEQDTVSGREFLAELQWMPIAADIFWQERGWQFGVLGGLSTFEGPSKAPVSPYVGLKTDFYFSPTIFTSLAFRNGTGFSQSELNVGVRI